MKPRLLDLFCKDGGAAMGYHRAGFDVVGVDIDRRPKYPFRFIQADAMTFALDGFDAVHASPPCQAFTTMSNRWRGAGGRADDHVNLIPDTRTRLEATGLPWVIENVPGARRHLRNAVTLTGGMFGLGVDRPRLFESNVLLMLPEPVRARDPLGVYGKAPDGRRLFTRVDGSIQRAASSAAEAGEAMGIDWMDWDGLREAIPPAYTEHIGLQLIRALQAAA